MCHSTGTAIKGQHAEVLSTCSSLPHVGSRHRLRFSALAASTPTDLPHWPWFYLLVNLFKFSLKLRASSWHFHTYISFYLALTCSLSTFFLVPFLLTPLFPKQSPPCFHITYVPCFVLLFSESQTVGRPRG